MLLKNCADVLVDATYSLFKLVAFTHTWPTLWGTSRVCGVHKRDDRANAKNYRPIAGLDNLSLCFERTIDPQFDGWIYKFIPQCQFGFRKACGTDDYGAAVSAELTEALEKLWEVLLISLDVAGAFDKVWWKALIANLQHCGLGGKALHLIESYLSNRKFKVVANGKASAAKSYYAGVPQGGIWSPKLWNFHIRELAFVVQFTKLFKYADDSALMKIIKGVIERTEAVGEVDQDLQAIVDWGKKWKVQFEPKKTHALLCTRKRRAGMKEPTMDGKKIKFVSDLKLVGLTIDSRLNWKKMACSAASKGRSMIGALYRMKSLLKPSDLQTIYKSFVRSKMEFGSLEYIAAAPTHLAKLDRVQRAAERICDCTFDSLVGRREAAVFSLVCKLLDEECVQPLQNFAPKLAIKGAIEGGPKTRQRTAAEDDNSLKLENKTDQLRSFSIHTYKYSWQAQAPQILDKVPSDLKTKGAESFWSKVKSAGKEILNGSAERKKTYANLKAKKAKKKLNHKTQKAVSTGSAILNNELNAKLTDWIQYAITWNTNKT
jgi:hypothetical protein